MPEVEFYIEWPDGTTQKYYSPSTSVHDYFQTGTELSIEELLEKSRRAYARARQRVKARYGFLCTQSLDAERSLEDAARQYQPDQRVRIVRMAPEPAAGEFPS